MPLNTKTSCLNDSRFGCSKQLSKSKFWRLIALANLLKLPFRLFFCWRSYVLQTIFGRRFMMIDGQRWVSKNVIHKHNKVEK